MKNRLRKVQFKYLDYLFENIRSVKSKYYPDSTFFKKNDKVILELEKSGTLWILYSVWSNISDTFSFEYEETQQLIKAWMEQQLKSGEITPRNAIAAPFRWRELDSEEVRPHILPQGWCDRVEEELKYAEIKPNATLTSYHLKVVEEELKLEEITPRQVVSGSFDWVQDKIKLEEITPKRMDYVIIGGIEEELESVEITPDIKGHSGSYWAESQLKLEEITPHLGHTYEMGKIDEQLKLAEITPVKFYETELQFLEEQLKLEILKLSKDEKK